MGGGRPLSGRGGAGRRGRGSGTVDDVLQFLAGFEIGNFFGGDFDSGTGFGIAANAGLALAGAETAESADFNFISGAEGTYDAVKDSLHDHLGFLPGHLDHARDFFNQIGLRHRILLDSKLVMNPQYRLNSIVLQGTIRGRGPSGSSLLRWWWWLWRRFRGSRRSH